MTLMYILIGVVVIAAAWWYFGKDAHKAAVNETAKKSLVVVDDVTKKSLAAVDDAAKKSLVLLDGAAKKSLVVMDDAARRSMSEAAKITANLTQTSRDFANRIGLGRGIDDPEDYRQWLEGEETAGRAAALGIGSAWDDLKRWSAGLSADDLKAISQEAAYFCTSQNFDFSWLGSAELGKSDAALKNSMIDALVLFSLAKYKTWQLRGNVDVVAVYEAWLQDPGKGRNLSLSQKIFAKMVDERKVQASPELLLAPEKERREFVIKTVKEYSENNPKSFYLTLKSVVDEMAAPAATPAQKAAPKSAAAKPGAEKSAAERSAPASAPARMEQMIDTDFGDIKPAQKRVSRRGEDIA